MEVYKVIFQDNVAVEAHAVDFSLRKSVKVENTDNKRSIKWLPVFADSEQESIIIANRLVSFYLSLQPILNVPGM